MTYEEIYKDFLNKTGIDKSIVENYGLCCETFDVPNIANAIIVWLNNGAEIIYRHKNL